MRHGLFCAFGRGAVRPFFVHEDQHSVAILVARTLFAGHTLLVPRPHYDTLADLTAPLPPGESAAQGPRPGHNTPLLVLYGSNLGTAEELATRVAELAEVNGFATRPAPPDE